MAVQQNLIASLLSIFLFCVSLFPLESTASLSRPPATDSVAAPEVNPAGAYDPDSAGVSTSYKTSSPGGLWKVFTRNSGVSGIHWAITPKYNTLVMIDRSDKDNSYLTLPDGSQAYACVHDLANPDTAPRPLELINNAFCSGGQFWPNGTLVMQGGFEDAYGNDLGYSGVRHLDPCPAGGKCDFYEYEGVKLLAKRWYPAVHLMPEGDRMVIIGGSTAGNIFIIYDEKQSEANYEFYPQTKPADRTLRDLPVLKRAFPCPLYPFLHLMPNGYFFVMANMDAVLYNFDTEHEIILPKMPGKITRSYPYTGTSVLLPLSKENGYTAEVLVCGGSPFSDVADRDAWADNSCGRIRPLDKNPTWRMERMPDRRILTDGIITANGQVIIVNGARQGRAGNSQSPSFAHNPVYTPALYNPNAPTGKRWQNLNPSTIPRLYHSLAILAPNGALLIGGSAPYDCCSGCGPDCYGNKCDNTDVCYPNEFTIERFDPPYFFSSIPKPVIRDAPARIAYGAAFDVVVKLRPGLTLPALRAAIVNPGYGTHSQHMGHRFVWLEVDYTSLNYDKATGQVKAKITGPPSNTIPPPGFYYLFCHDSNIPSKSVWVQLL